MSCFPDLATVKTWLNIAVDTDDAFLTHKMLVAQSLMERYTNRLFCQEERTEVFDLDKCGSYGGVKEIILKAQPVIQVVEVTGSGLWHLTDHGTLCVPRSCGEERDRRVTVKYIGGFDPLPPELLEIFYGMIGYAHANKGTVASNAGQIKSETVFGVAKTDYVVDSGDSSSGSGDPSLPSYYSGILDSYRLNQV